MQEEDFIPRELRPPIQRGRHEELPTKSEEDRRELKMFARMKIKTSQVLETIVIYKAGAQSRFWTLLSSAAYNRDERTGSAPSQRIADVAKHFWLVIREFCSHSVGMQVSSEVSSSQPGPHCRRPPRGAASDSTHTVPRKWITIHFEQITFFCDVDNRVLDVAETELCVYEVHFATPAACWWFAFAVFVWVSYYKLWLY